MKLASEIYAEIYEKYESQFSPEFLVKIEKEKLKLAKKISRSIAVDTKVYDFAEMEYFTIAEAFEKMKNSMFVVRYRDEYFVFDKGELLRTLVTGSGIAYECKNVSEALHFRESDIKPEKCYFKLPINFNAYIEINNFCKSIIEDQMVEVLDTNETLIAMLNENAIAKDAHLNYRFESMNVMSGDHCQAGSDRRVFKLQSLKNKDLRERFYDILKSKKEEKVIERNIKLALELYSPERILDYLGLEINDIEEVKTIYDNILHSKEIKKDFIKEINEFIHENDTRDREFKIEEIRLNLNNEQVKKHYYYFQNEYEERYALDNAYFFLPIEIIVSFKHFSLTEYINFEKTKNLIKSEDQNYFSEYFGVLRDGIMPLFIKKFSDKLKEMKYGSGNSISRRDIKYDDIIEKLDEKFIFTLDSLYSL